MYDVNLLPTKLQKKINIDIGRLIILISMATIVFGFIFGYSFFLFQMNITQQELHNIEEQLKQMAPRVAEVEKMKKERLSLEKKVQAFSIIVNNRLAVSHVFNDIASNMPVDMWLTSIRLEYREKYVPRGGFASSGDLPSEVRNYTEKKKKTPGKAEDNEEKALLNMDDKDNKRLLPPNVLVLQGVTYSTASVGVFVHNLSQLPCFHNIDLIKVFPNTTGDIGQAFTIEARLSGGR